MSRLRFYLTVIGIHAKHGSKRQALGFAFRHWRFWRGAEAYTDALYIHIGSADSEKIVVDGQHRLDAIARLRKDNG